MAAAWSNSETEDLVTCSVCYTEFDEVSHRPKFLACFHTICLQCLSAMCKEKRVACPLCRQETACPSAGPSALPNNPYVLHLSRMQQTGALLEPCQESEWCLTCGSASVSADCASSRHWLIMGNWSEAQRLQKRRDSTKMKYALAAEKRQTLRNYLCDIQRALNNVLDDVEEQIDDNDFQLTQLASLLEDEIGHFGRESLTSARMQIDREAQEAEESLVRIGQSMDQHETENRLRIKIDIRSSDGHKIPSCSFLDNGFSRDSGEWRELANEKDLISHLVFGILRRQREAHCDSPVKCPPVTADPVPVAQSASIEPAQPVSADNEPCTAVDVAIPATLSKSTLVMKFQDGGKSIGNLRIRPSDDFLESFVCHFQRSITYVDRILKAKVGSFLTLAMDTDVAIHEPIRWTSQEVRTAGQVGICDELIDGSGDLLTWNWVFLLKDFDRREVKSSFLFGHIVDGFDVIHYLTGVSRNHRSKIKFTLKSA